MTGAPVRRALPLRTRLRNHRSVYAAYRLTRYLILELRFLLEALRDRLAGHRGEAMPLPPPRLRYRVHGLVDRRSFQAVGRNIAAELQGLCARADCDVRACREILDFGCGCGRVLRNLLDTLPAARIAGTDIDPALIRWCAAHLPGAAFEVNDFRPPLPFAGSRFDLIYSISVFSHIDETLQHEWLHELRRIARPGAHVVISVHGDFASRSLGEDLRDRLSRNGIVYVATARGRWKLDGLPDFYQSTYHTEAYIRRVWSNYFTIVDYVERGINNHQAAVVLRKRC